MNSSFLLASLCYHDTDSFPGVIWGDDDYYYGNENQNYNFYSDDDYGSGDSEINELRNVENLRRRLFTNYSIDTRPVIDYDQSVGTALWH